MRQSLFDRTDGLAGIQVLRTNLRAIHDGVTPVQLERVVEIVQSFLGLIVSRIFDPPVRLHQHGGSEVLVGIPPVRRTARRTACAQNAFVHAIQFVPILFGLQKFAGRFRVGIGVGRAIRRFRTRLQPRFDAPVLFVKISHVGHQIFQHVHVREGINFRRPFGIVVDVRKTRQRIRSLDVHRARPTNPFSAAPTERQSGILLVFDFQQRVQHHRSALVQIDGVRRQVRFLVFDFGIPPVHLEVFDPLVINGRIAPAFQLRFARCRCRGKRIPCYCHRRNC